MLDPPRSDTGAWAGLAVWLLLVYGAAAIGGQFTPGAWYDALDKPPWTPPGWIFGPVWILLYGMMAAAAWVVWKEDGVRGARLPLAFFLGQLALNAAWSWLFFGLQRPDLALVDIVLLVAAVAVTLVLFGKRSALAGWLLAPYLLWVSFATALNLEIWRLNL